MFWTNFEKLCAEIGKSPNAVATELGIPSGSITAWSKGTKPRNQTIKKIADYFGVTTQNLLLGGDEVSLGVNYDKLGKKKELAENSEFISPEKQQLMSLIDTLSDEQCRRLAGIIEEAKKLL